MKGRHSGELEGKRRGAGKLVVGTIAAGALLAVLLVLGAWGPGAGG